MKIDDSKVVDFSESEVRMLTETVDRGIKPVSQSLVNSFHELYRNGFSCSEIANKNPGFTEGDILYLRYKNDWDAKINEDLTKKMDQAKMAMLQSRTEGIRYLSNIMMAHQKFVSTRLEKYLQTGDESHLPPWLHNFRSFKDSLEALLKLTGEAQTQKHQTTVTLQTPKPTGQNSQNEVKLDKKTILRKWSQEDDQ